jgi:hypothetical protein
LIGLPIMQDADRLAAMTLLSYMHPSWFFSGDKPLSQLNIATVEMHGVALCRGLRERHVAILRCSPLVPGQVKRWWHEADLA